MSQRLIIRDFQFARDFRSIGWKETLWYNLMRLVFGFTLVLLVAMLFSDPKQNTGGSIWDVAKLIIGLPIAYIVFIVPITLLVAALHKVPFIGFLGLIPLVFGVIMAFGDPLVCLLKKFIPDAVPIEEPTLFSITPIFWLINADEYSIAE